MNITSPPHKQKPSTYKRGKSIIDHIWVSKEIVHLGTSYSYLTYDLGFDSDHRGVYIDIRYLQNENPPLTTQKSRRINFNKVQSIDR